MMATKRPRRKHLPEQKDRAGLLASAARTVGAVAGGIAKVVIELGGNVAPSPDEQPKNKPRSRKAPAVSRRSPATAKPKVKAKARGAEPTARKRTSKPASKRK
jgi:hypothetical protein